MVPGPWFSSTASQRSHAVPLFSRLWENIYCMWPLIWYISHLICNIWTRVERVILGLDTQLSFSTLAKPSAIIKSIQHISITSKVQTKLASKNLTSISAQSKKVCSQQNTIQLNVSTAPYWEVLSKASGVTQSEHSSKILQNISAWLNVSKPSTSISGGVKFSFWLKILKSAYVMWMFSDVRLPTRCKG